MRRSAYVLAGLGLVALLGDGACGGTDSSRVGESRSDPLIAFFRTVPGDPPRYDLATARADGRGLRVLSGMSLKGTVVPSLFTRPAWSPDGRLIAFGGVRGASPGFHGDVYVVAAGGGAQRQVTKLGDAFRPLWSHRPRKDRLHARARRRRDPGGVTLVDPSRR